MKIINFEKKKMRLLTNKQQRFVIFVKKYLKINMLKIKNIAKVGTIAIIQVNIELLQITYVFRVYCT